MDDDDFRDEITQLEARSEALTESIERCRKISLAAKLTIAAGAIWIVLVLLGVIAFSPGTIIAAMAAVLGGIVLLGSNATTWTQTDAALHEAEAMRADLIGRMELPVVGEERPMLN
jgi:uncharacterized membrane protein YqjE